MQEHNEILIRLFNSQDFEIGTIIFFFLKMEFEHRECKSFIPKHTYIQGPFWDLNSFLPHLRARDLICNNFALVHLMTLLSHPSII